MQQYKKHIIKSQNKIAKLKYKKTKNNMNIKINAFNKIKHLIIRHFFNAIIKTSL